MRSRSLRRCGVYWRHCKNNMKNCKTMVDNCSDYLYCGRMRSRTLRTISLVVLFAMISMVTGLGSTYAASVSQSEQCSCDSAGQKDDGKQCPDEEGQCPTPCNSSFCPLFTCMVAVIPSSLAVASPFHAVSFSSFTPSYVPDPPAGSIFHPPSLV